MINEITISNFLSHEHTKLEFSPGVNIIVGPTDSGKSAIIKAIRWVLTNRPMGDGMRSRWGGETCVEIEATTVDEFNYVEDGIVVKRIKGKINGYEVGGLALNAIKGEVPDEVIKYLNLHDINLQTQFDSHFLLSKSAGEVAKVFNEAAHLDQIDIALQNIQKWTRDAQRNLEYNKESLETSQERLKSYESLDSIERLLISLEEKEKERQRLSKERQNIVKICDSIKEVSKELDEVGFLQELEGVVTNTLKVIDKQKVLIKEFDKLTNLLDSIKSLQISQDRIEKKLMESETEFHNELSEGSICPLCEQVIIALQNDRK